MPRHDEKLVIPTWERAEARCLFSMPLCVDSGGSIVDKSTVLCTIVLDHVTAVNCVGGASVKSDCVRLKHIRRQVS